MHRINTGDTVGICACSNPLAATKKPLIEDFIRLLKSRGITSLVSPLLYESDPGAYDGKQRADALTALYRNPNVMAIFDVSGGDMANEVLLHLDFSVIAANEKPFFGYSDLSVMLNAIYTMTGRSSVLFQPRHLTYHASADDFLTHFYDISWNIQKSDGGISRDHLTMQAAYAPCVNPMFQDEDNHKKTASSADAVFMDGIVIGGNLRCFLKLAGTAFWPDMHGKILFLESLGGQIPQMLTYLSQYKLLGAFDQIDGLLLGTFTEMEENHCQPDIYHLIRRFTGPDLPIAVTTQIGHSKDARAIRIGERISLIRT